MALDSVTLISGLSLGFEYISANPEEHILKNCLVLDLLFIRFIITL